MKLNNAIIEKILDVLLVVLQYVAREAEKEEEARSKNNITRIIDNV